MLIKVTELTKGNSRGDGDYYPMEMLINTDTIFDVAECEYAEGECGSWINFIPADVLIPPCGDFPNGLSNLLSVMVAESPEEILRLQAEAVNGKV